MFDYYVCSRLNRLITILAVFNTREEADLFIDTEVITDIYQKRFPRPVYFVSKSVRLTKENSHV